MADVHHHFVRVEFHRFKVFRSFSVSLRGFNILVGPNNAGKSTILAAFRILAAAMRKATSRKPEIVRGPSGRGQGYSVDLTEISVAGENIFYNYDDTEPASITFTLSNGNKLLLYFPDQGSCNLIPEKQGRPVASPTTFRANFNCPIRFVPILGPVEHNERLFGREAARLALFNYTASRNFRNIWHHYPEKFEDFREMLAQTWPGMDIQRPTISGLGEKPLLHMFCPEERIPREIFWAGFGFQVWCQMLTHLIQSTDAVLFLIDEPDIYLHSDLQRQLLGILRDLGPDILIATHSTEIISEAEADEIVIISKSARSGRRIKNPSELGDVFSMLGSNLNPILTQLAKTRRALFVEGDDFQILSRFARRLSLPHVANRKDFALVPVKGFNPERIKSLKSGMEITLGGSILAMAVMDRDYRSQEERDSITSQCKEFCKFVTIHGCKEIENFLLVPEAIDRAAARRLSDAARRSTGKPKEYKESAAKLLNSFAAEKKNYVLGQYVEARQRYARTKGLSLSTITEAASADLERSWSDEVTRLQIIPGKDAMARMNQFLQEEYGISVTPAAIIESMWLDEIPSGMKEFLWQIASFTTQQPA
jgi:AAA domain, putative AbiEii toxin, Type IV TA system